MGIAAKIAVLMIKPDVSIIVCGRFHYHKFIHLLLSKGILNQFIYSYKKTYNFKIPAGYLKNFYFKEYLMYAGRVIIKGKLFYRYLALLHSLWQQQVCSIPPKGNICHFLVHGNCDRIVRRYKNKGIKVIGEVVNAHPAVQSALLTKEYKKHGLLYESADKLFEDKIINEYSLCDFLLVPSVFLKNSLVHQGLDDARIFVLPYGINRSVSSVKTAKQISKNSTIKLLCVSQITFRKGTVYLCEALELLKSEGFQCELTLVGGIDLLYKSTIQNYLTAENIKHIPHVDNSEIENLMVTHDLLIMPSIEDGFGIVVSEALAVHLPVIVTCNCGASEVITEGKNGFIIEPFSAGAIADAIIKSIGYPFQFTDPVFTWDDYASRLENFYTSILN